MALEVLLQPLALLWGLALRVGVWGCWALGIGWRLFGQLLARRSGKPCSAEFSGVWQRRRRRRRPRPGALLRPTRRAAAAPRRTTARRPLRGRALSGARIRAAWPACLAAAAEVPVAPRTAPKLGPNVLFFIANRTNCILLVSVQHQHNEAGTSRTNLQLRTL
jgi:hypothetical protein